MPFFLIHPCDRLSVGPDSSTEVSEAGERFLTGLFTGYQPQPEARLDTQELSKICPRHAFTGSVQEVALEEFLNAWRLMALERPRDYVEAMAYLGFCLYPLPGETTSPADALHGKQHASSQETKCSVLKSRDGEIVAGCMLFQKTYERKEREAKRV